MLRSSLHLHFLKTLEFRTDVSVTSMPGVGVGHQSKPLPHHHLPMESKT
uniref:Uncharacterized protein n=1 Tax=Mus spicilegus TaxID=10103 RepID=A0A8C6GBS2_MUSSI